jgi:hypothetical protein
MSLLAEVTQVLDRAEVRYALIGAMAMATHGVSRSTQDLDLLAVDPIEAVGRAYPGCCQSFTPPRSPATFSTTFTFAGRSKVISFELPPPM